MAFIQLAIGLVLLLGGGEALVKGSVAVARRLGVSPLLIGLTLVGFGTSTPELVASIEAALIGAPGIAIGNIVGSNIANVLLVLGLSAVIFPLATTKQAFGETAGC
jgi:cation:H+ antiporter